MNQFRGLFTALFVVGTLTSFWLTSSTAQAAYYDFKGYYEQSGSEFVEISGDPAARYNVTVVGGTVDAQGNVQIDFDHNGTPLFVKGVARGKTISIKSASPALKRYINSRSLRFENTPDGRYYIRTIYSSLCSCTVWLGF